MKVRPRDGGEFWVTSQDDPDEYLVDVCSNDGRMVCTCPDFRFRAQRNLDIYKSPKPYSSPERTICKHCNAVLIFLGQSTVAAMNETQRTKLFDDDI